MTAFVFIFVFWIYYIGYTKQTTYLTDVPRWTQMGNSYSNGSSTFIFINSIVALRHISPFLIIMPSTNDRMFLLTCRRFFVRQDWFRCRFFASWFIRCHTKRTHFDLVNGRADYKFGRKKKSERYINHYVKIFPFGGSFCFLTK